ncbi:MAG: PH domain-containing protein [Deltaproteobacteria bacterium]|nr:PH domain-containing protein [Deltaproteobacteria bacterium]
MEPRLPTRSGAPDDAAIKSITRPDGNLLVYYVLASLMTAFAFPIVILPLVFKYYTLRYTLDDEGVSASWGLFFRREVYLTYRRIQDIHVRRNIVERWLGIGTVDIQTASGSSTAEMKLEGMTDYEAVRDFLYRRMRGHAAIPGASAATALEAAGEAPAGEARVIALLGEIKDELEATREALAARER